MSQTVIDLMENLPSLSSLRAFEAAARLGSFQQGAHELGLTPSAISYQIRNLEETLGASLFVRQHRKIALTEAGRTLYKYVHRGFNELRNGAAAVRAVRTANVLRVTAAPAFANAFLSHGLRTFEKANPRLEVQLVVAHRVLDLAAEGLDIAIRFASAPIPDAHCVELATVSYTPVAAPRIARALGDLRDLQTTPLIRVREHDAGWRDWFQQHHDVGRPACALEVETMNVAVQAALDGQGVALLPRVIVARHIQAGTLAAPFDSDLQSENRYWLVCRRGDQDVPKIRRFAKWLSAEIERSTLRPLVVG